MTCPDFDTYKRYIRSFEQSKEIDKNKDKPLRFNVWKTTSDTVKQLFTDFNVDNLPQDDIDMSAPVKRRIAGALARMSEMGKLNSAFKKDVIDSASNIEKSIALYEVMESVKGEADKASNNGIDISEISADGLLPSLPLSRVAASIGRKIAFQKGYRFNSKDSDGKTISTAAEVETLYYQTGMRAIEELQADGYLAIQDDVKVIKDFIKESEIGNKNAATGVAVSGIRSVAINTDKLKIKAGSQEAKYFLNRASAVLSDTELGAAVQALRAIRMVTQPSTIVLPDTAYNRNFDYAHLDATGVDPESDKARKGLYQKPLFVNSSVSGLLSLLNKEVLATGRSAVDILTKDVLDGEDALISSLFGLQNIKNAHVDREESIVGQNLSKSTAIEDLAEHYDLLEGKPLHMALYDGRNKRFYYSNTVLNPHASKQSRHMLTPGKYTVKQGSDDFNFLVNNVAELLGDKTLSYNDFVSDTGSKLDKALKHYAKYESGTTLTGKIAPLTHISVLFPGSDYVKLITVMQAVKDIRSAKDGVVTTEFPVSSDATASGGTLMLTQAAGDNENIPELLAKLGVVLGEDGTFQGQEGFDLYGVMSEAVENFVANPEDSIASSKVSAKDLSDLVKDTVSVLFGSLRDYAKQPTMTFIYGQGSKGSINSMNTAIADNLIDSLDKEESRAYLAKLTDKYLTATAAELKSTEGLYQEIIDALDNSGISKKMYKLLQENLSSKYLKERNVRGSKIFKLAEKYKHDVNFKILPAAAVMSGITPTKSNIDKYGMPISKVFEVEHDIGNGDSVLTRKSEMRESVMNVSPIHGIDSALLYLAIDLSGVDGVVVVHDQVLGNVKDVRKVEDEYRKLFLESSLKYDIHKEMLNSIKAYDPEVAESQAYKSVEAEVDSSIEAKRKLFKSSFNESTSALIGDGDAHLRFAENAKAAETKPKAAKVAKVNSDSATVLSVVTALASESEIISKFLASANRSDFVKGKRNEYLPSEDVVTITGTDEGIGNDRPLDLNKPADRKMQKEIIEHEIVHAMTTSYVQKGFDGTDKVASMDVAYILKAVNSLKAASFEKMMNLSPEAQDRVSYITGKSDPVAVSELISVLSTEPAVAEEIYKLLDDKVSLAKRIADFVKRIKQRLLSISAEDLSNELDVEKLYSAISRSIQLGGSEREANYEYAVQNQKAFATALGAGTGSKLTQQYLNFAVSSMLNTQVEMRGRRIAKNLHDLLAIKYPLYIEVTDKIKGVYDSSDALQQLMHTISGEGVNKNRKADLLSKMAALNTQHMAVLNSQKEAFNKELKKLSSEKRKAINSYVTKMPLHDYFILASDLDTGDKIDKEIDRLTAKYAHSRDVLATINSLIGWSIGFKDADGTRKQVPSKVYNLATKYSLKAETEAALDYRKLLALKSIKELGYTDFEALLANKDLTDLIRDSSVANRLSVLGHDGQDNLRDSMMADVWKEPVIMKAVTAKQLRSYTIGESTGWEVLRLPVGATGLGIVYKKIIDSTNLAGAYTDIKVSSTDINVSDNKKDYDGVVASPNGYKLLLTDKEKETLGINEDFSETLAHTTAHSMAIQDSQAIRDELLMQETRVFVTDKASEEALKQTLAASNEENPWFVKLSDTIHYSELSPEIKAKYKEVKRASNVEGFNNEISLVRKDISHWLIGDSAKSLFANTKYQWMFRILKNLVAGAKLNMVVLNPVKIANDNLSNIAYLSVMGADPIFIAKNYADISKAYNQYHEIRNSINELRIKLAANPNNKALKARMDKLQEEAKNTSIGDIESKGFMNSLGSDILHQNADSASGLQADMHTAIDYLMKDKKGNNNALAIFITRLSNIGWHTEDFVKYLGGIVGKFDTTKGAQAELDRVYDRLKTIRTDEDITNYVAQYTTSPASEFVKIGGKVTDLTDVLAKETLYRHLVENEGMSPEDARIRVLDSFPDYKENMPIAIKQMSDAGIIMFPSFWLRIQKVIYRMVKDKPVNFGTEMMLQSMLDTNINTILGSNIVEKSNSFGGIFHTPFEHIGASSVLPKFLL